MIPYPCRSSPANASKMWNTGGVSGSASCGDWSFINTSVTDILEGDAARVNRRIDARRLNARGRPGSDHREHLIVELEGGRPRLMVPRVPAVRLLQPGFERRHLNLQYAGDLADVLGNRRQVVIF